MSTKRLKKKRSKARGTWWWDKPERHRSRPTTAKQRYRQRRDSFREMKAWLDSLDTKDSVRQLLELRDAFAAAAEAAKGHTFDLDKIRVLADAQRQRIRDGWLDRTS